MAGLGDLDPYGADGALRVVVECPRGASVKLAYAPMLGTFTVARTLPLGLTYPFDWGFIPGTLADDGDPIDALALHDMGTYPGVVLPCRAIGVVELTQRNEKGKRERNDRVIAIPLWHDRLGELERATDLPTRLRDEIEQFFLSATFFTGKKPKIIGWKSARKAASLVNAARQRFVQKHGKS
jgi:inorganic pyrophosphatase